MVKRVQKSSDGKYHIKGKTYELLIGSRAQVHHGTAFKTPGGLTKKNLLKNRNGRIVSRKKHMQSKKNNQLAAHGWGAEKGKFGAIRLNDKKTRRRKK